MLLVSLFLVMFSVAAEDRPIIAIPFIESEIVVDGELNETIWSDASEFPYLKQVWPGVNDRQLDEQRVLIFQSERFLYLGAKFKVGSNGLIANTLRNNQDTSGDDTLTLLIDTHSSRKNAYWFSINPNGVKNDGLVVNNTKSIIEWDEIWYAKSLVSKNYWTLEIAIPLALLSHVPEDQIWGVNVVRKIAEGQREYRWSNVSQDNNYLDPKHYGRAIGIKKFGSDTNVDLRYAISLNKLNQTGGNEEEVSPSIDINYRITPSISASLTLNTDFSITDVDDQELNLGRFELFKPEKRNFFLQDAAIYEFGQLDKNGKPFFSRKIGLSSDGQEIGVNAGVKFSGYGNNWSAGFMSINTDRLIGKGAKQLTVARGIWQFSDEFQAGTILTDGDPYSEHESQTYGLDFNYRSQGIVQDKTVEFGGWIQQSNNEELTKNNNAWGVFASYPNDVVNWYVGVEELEDNFLPKLGFVNRNGIRRYTLKGRYRHHFNQNQIRLLDTSFNAFITTDLRGALATSNFYWNFLDFTSEDGDFLRLAVEDSRENLASPFELLGRIRVTEQDYHFNRFWIIARTTESRKWSLHGRFNAGEYFDGDKTSLSLELKVTPSLNWNSSIKVQTDKINIREQQLTFTQVKLKLDYIFSNQASWQNYLQFDDLTRKLGIQSRYSWIPEAGVEFNFVINSRYFRPYEGSWQRETENIIVHLSGVWRF